MLRRLVGAGAIALACAPLVAGPPQTADWLNSVWMIGYGADHLRRTGLPPGAFHTHELGGIPFPVFYGFLVYPLLSGLALAVGAANALRLAVVGVVALQFVLVRRAVRTGGGDELLATAAACLTVWTVYPLTNAYTRGAMMEFLGTGLLTCAVCRWFALLDAGTPRARIRAALELGFLYTLAAGAHPITALYGFVFLALHAVTAFARGGCGGKRLLALVPAGMATVAVLAPWVYAYAALKDVLKIRTSGLHLFPDDIDAWWLRLSPLPLDAWLLSGLVPRPGPTPYLDAQVNVPLILLAAGVAWATARRVGRPARWLLVPAVLGVVFLLMSLWSEPYEVLPAAFQMVQFPYRLVTYVNLTALSGVLLALRLGEPPVRRSRRTALLLAVLGLSALGLGFKLYPVCGPVPRYRLDPAHLPPFFYGWYDYSAAEHYPPLLMTPEAEARTVARARMSLAREYEPLRITMAEPGYVVVPVQPFPWNAIEVDGRVVPEEQLRVWTARDPAAVGDWTRPPYLAVPVPSGEHVVAYRFRPPAAWRRLTALSFATLLLSGGCVLVFRFRWATSLPQPVRTTGR